MSGCYDGYVQGCVFLILVAIFFTLAHEGYHVVCRSIKVWDFQAALDPKTPANTICWRTLVSQN